MYRVLCLLAVLILPTFGSSSIWAPLAPMPTPRSDHSAVTLGDVIIVAGGCRYQFCADNTSCSCTEVTAVVEAYNPATDKWSTLASMPAARFRHGAVAIDTYIYVFGGRDVGDNLLQTVYVYDSVLNSWTTLPNQWAQATSDMVSVASGYLIYAIGGYDANYDSLNVTCTLDLLANNSNWDCVGIAPMNTGRGDSCGVVVQNSEIFVVGGFSAVNFCAALDSLEVYNIANNTWEVRSRLHSSRADSACAYLHDRFHAVGGEQKDKLTDCSIFDIPILDTEYWVPENNTWVEETPLPDARFRFESAVYNDEVYLFGGQGLVLPNGTQPIIGIVSVLTGFHNATCGTCGDVSSASLVGNIGQYVMILIFASMFAY